jgi:hypothetical protein
MAASIKERGKSMHYLHTQKVPGKVMALAGLTGIAIGLSPPGLLLRLALLGTLAGAAAVFRSLTVGVDDSTLSHRFNGGLFKKCYLLEEIASAEKVRTSPFQGWGIHWIGCGWLYNVYGLDAVEVCFKNGKRVFIGSDDAENMAAAINEGLGR